MKLEDIEYVKRDHAAWITLNRPRALNAITVGMLHSLKQAFEDARDDDQVRVVVITGAGRGFCAGADVKVMHDQSLEEMRTFDKLLTSTWKFIRTFPKPTIAAINGVVVGGGFEITLLCDFRIASTSARLGSAEVNINQPMTNGATYLLPRLIGETKAKELGMTGDLIDAEEAVRIGLINTAVDGAELERTVTEWVDKLVSRGPIAVSLVKRCFARSREVDIDTAVMMESDAATECFISADQQEGLRAFLEKRAPRWSGK